jgi:ribosomal protein L37AE/L43A
MNLTHEVHCPNCGNSNVNRGIYPGYWWCYDCDLGFITELTHAERYQATLKTSAALRAGDTDFLRKPAHSMDDNSKPEL